MEFLFTEQWDKGVCLIYLVREEAAAFVGIIDSLPVLTDLEN